MFIWPSVVQSESKPMKDTVKAVRKDPCWKGHLPVNTTAYWTSLEISPVWKDHFFMIPRAVSLDRFHCINMMVMKKWHIKLGNCITIIIWGSINQTDNQSTRQVYAKRVKCNEERVNCVIYKLSLTIYWRTQLKKTRATAKSCIYCHAQHYKLHKWYLLRAME